MSSQCSYCSTMLPDRAFFCPSCAKQIKCRSCSEPLEKDAVICICCGVRIGESINNRNHIEFSGDDNGVKFKADFSDSAAAIVSDTFLQLAKVNKQPLRTINSQRNELSLDNSIRDSHIKDETKAVNANVEVNTTSTRNNSADEEGQNIGTDPANYKLFPDITANSVSDNQFPAIKSIALRGIVSNEGEWVLIYCFYASNFGEQSFTSMDIRKKYDESSRKSVNRLKSIYRYILLLAQKRHIEALNDNLYIITQEGKETVLNILKRTTPSSAQKRQKDKKSSEGNDKKSAKIPRLKNEFVELGLDESQRKSLKDFVQTKAPKTQGHQVMTVLFWLQENLQRDRFTRDEIFTALRTAECHIPQALDQVLTNLKSKDNYISKAEKKHWKLTGIGTDLIKDKLPLNTDEQ